MILRRSYKYDTLAKEEGVDGQGAVERAHVIAYVDISRTDICRRTMQRRVAFGHNLKTTVKTTDNLKLLCLRYWYRRFSIAAERN
jgi:hypothetical protein